MALFAGLDGGASRTRVRVTDEAGRVLGEGRSGPSSLTIGVEIAVRSVAEALDQALAGAGGGRGDCRLVAGLAGLRQPELRAGFERGLAGLAGLEVISDGYAALLGAHRGAPGAIVIVGTGSVALRLEADGRCRQAGGWGPVAGDEGSGSWLGRNAVRAALRAADETAAGAGSDTPLLSELRARIGPSHERILDWLRAADAARFAALVPLVLEHAAVGDPVAERLLAEAVQEVERLIRLIGDRGRFPVALGGGLALALEPRLELAVRMRLVPAASDAVDGALLRARGAAPPELYAS